MSLQWTRRDFLAASAVAGTSAALAARSGVALADDPAWKTTLHKAMLGAPNEEVLKKWKAAGFEGYESTLWNQSAEQAANTRKAAAAAGLKIHSVLFGWGDSNLGDAELAATIAKMETALKTSQAYGGTTVLFVPCKIGGMPMPQPWEFDIKFDEKTDHLKQVVAGDNTKYEKYIAAHDHAVDTSRECVTRLISTAEKTGIIIALENVWNNLWVKPDVFANFVASFNHPLVKAYFDIGNHVKYAPPQDWIRTLGKLVAKCHVKDFKLNPDGHGGDFCNIRDGSVDWPAVRKALDAIGYNGWLSIEGGSLSIEEGGRRLDLIVAGKLYSDN
jgi:hexulose-6-phosphate isomerase